LQALADRHPMKFTKSQLAAIVHFSDRGELYSGLSTLRSKGYAVIENNQIFLTGHELQAAGKTPDRQGAEKLTLEQWQRRLSGGTKRIFDFLVAEYPTAFIKLEF